MNFGQGKVREFHFRQRVGTLSTMYIVSLLCIRKSFKTHFHQSQLLSSALSSAYVLTGVWK